MNYNNRKPLSKRVIREQTKGQSVSEIQIVYKTKSDLNVFVILQRYAIFYLIKDFTVNKDFPLHRAHAEEPHLPPGKYPVPYSRHKY